MKSLILTLIFLATAATSHARSDAEVNSITNEIRMLHLKLAVKMSEARVNGYMCDADAYTPDVIRELTAFSSEPRKLAWAVSRFPVLMRDQGQNFTFKSLLAGFSIHSKKFDDLQKTLPGTTFYSRQGGAMGSTSRITFLTGGRAIYSALNVDDDMKPKWQDTNVGYKLSLNTQSAFVIEIYSPTTPTPILILKEGANPGDTMLVPQGQEDHMGYSSIAFECEA